MVEGEMGRVETHTRDEEVKPQRNRNASVSITEEKVGDEIAIEEAMKWRGFYLTTPVSLMKKNVSSSRKRVNRLRKIKVESSVN